MSRRIIFGSLLLTLLFGAFLPRLTFQFELEELFAQSEDFEFYQKHVAEFGFDNDYLNLIVIPKSPSIYDWHFLTDMHRVIDSIRTLEQVEFIHSPFSLRKVIKGPTGVQAYPLLKSREKLESDSSFIAEDPYLSQAFPQTNAFIILVKHQHFLDAGKSSVFMETVRPIIASLPYSYHLVGRLPAEKEFLSFIRTDFALFLGLSLVICGVILWWVCRHAKLVLYPFLVSVLSLIWTFGLMAMVNVPITILTSLLPPIILFVACSDTIHLISAFRRNHDPQKAMEKVLGPTFLTSITTAIGFFSMVWVPIGLIRDMGWVAGISVVFAFLITYALAPWFLRVNAPAEKKESELSWVLKITKKYPRLIMFVFMIFSGIGLWASLQLRVNAYLLHDMPPDAKTVRSFTFADQELGGSKPWEMALWVKDSNHSVWDEAFVGQMAKTVNYLESEYPVGNVQAPSKFMQYARYARHGTYDVKQVSKRDQILARRMERRSAIQLVTDDGRMARISGNIPEFGSLKTQQKNEALHQFMRNHVDSKLIGYHITGTNHLIDQTHHLLSRSMALSLLIAMVLVSFVFGVYFRSIKWAFIALVPNIVPLLVTGLLLYVLQVPIQLSTSIIFVLVFGIVVDDTIHFLATYKRAPKGTVEQKLQFTMETAGRGMLNTTLTLVAGFCLFLFSDFGGTYYLGFFICIALIAALITDWLLLPVILRKFNQDT